MTVSMLNIHCGYPWIDILGNNLRYDGRLKLKRGDGVYVAFTAAYHDPYWIRIINFNPAFTVNFYTVEYDGRDLFTTHLQCPAHIYDGIYYIDSTRARSSDLYNDVLKKIPDPTIRTALIGE